MTSFFFSFRILFFSTEIVVTLALVVSPTCSLIPNILGGLWARKLVSFLRLQPMKNTSFLLKSKKPLYRTFYDFKFAHKIILHYLTSIFCIMKRLNIL